MFQTNNTLTNTKNRLFTRNEKFDINFIDKILSKLGLFPQNVDLLYNILLKQSITYNYIINFITEDAFKKMCARNENIYSLIFLALDTNRTIEFVYWLSEQCDVGGCHGFLITLINRTYEKL